jgi:hypothetical protein
VDFLDAQPPSKDLLCTCTQIKDEARLMHRQAYRDYWTTTRFQLRATDDLIVQELEKKLPAWLNGVRAEDVAHIQRLEVSSIDDVAFCIFKRDTWTLWRRKVEREVWYLEWLEMWYAPERDTALAKAGFALDHVDGLATHVRHGIDVRDTTIEELEEAKKAAGRSGLDRWEILNAI